MLVIVEPAKDGLDKLFVIKRGLCATTASTFFAKGADVKDVSPHLLLGVYAC